MTDSRPASAPARWWRGFQLRLLRPVVSLLQEQMRTYHELAQAQSLEVGEQAKARYDELARDLIRQVALVEDLRREHGGHLRALDRQSGERANREREFQGALDSLASGLRRAEQAAATRADALDAALREAGHAQGREIAGLAALLRKTGEEAATAARRAGEISSRLEALRPDERLRELETTRKELRSLADKLDAELGALSGRHQLTAEALDMFARNTTLRADALESSLRDLAGRARETETALAAHAGEAMPGPDFDYTGFENRFRGDESLIRMRQKIHLPALDGRAPVWDLGCGRGEFLEVLGEAGIDALGVEENPGQVARCREKGLRVETADLRAWIAAAGADAAGAVTLLQVVEHLPLRDLERLIRDSRRALRPGGVLLMETVNPHCAEAMEWFYIDPTHRRPVYPEMLEFLLELAGFKSIKRRFFHPSSDPRPGAEGTEKTGMDYAIWGVKG